MIADEDTRQRIRDGYVSTSINLKKNDITGSAKQYLTDFINYHYSLTESDRLKLLEENCSSISTVSKDDSRLNEDIKANNIIKLFNKGLEAIEIMAETGYSYSLIDKYRPLDYPKIKERKEIILNSVSQEDVVCAVCGNEFKAKRGYHTMYCSVKCRRKSVYDRSKSRK